MSKADFSLSRRGFVSAGVAATGGALTSTRVHSQTRSPAMQATIRAEAQVITLVNLFTVEPPNLQTLIGLLRDGTESFFSRMPGFISSSVLTARNGRQAINCSQWRSEEEVAGFRKDPRFKPYIQSLLAVATAEAIECDVAYVKSA